MISNKSDLFKKGGLKSKVFTIESLGGEQLEITEMSLLARQKMMSLIASESGDNQGDVGGLVASSCVPILKGVTPEEVVSTLKPEVIEEIAGYVMQLSGIGESDDEDSPKN